MSTLTARDVRTECISVAQLMFLERSRAFYFERCSRVASSNTRITKHFFSSERELRETFERNREKKRKEKKSKNKKRKQERMREPSYSRKLGRTNQAEFESELSREIRGVLFACPHFFLLEKSFVEAECVFLLEYAMMTSSSWQLLREYVNYEKREIQIEKMEKEKRVRVVFEGKKQSADIPTVYNTSSTTTVLSQLVGDTNMESYTCQNQNQNRHNNNYIIIVITQIQL